MTMTDLKYINNFIYLSFIHMQMPSGADDSVCSFGVAYTYTDIQQV